MKKVPSTKSLSMGSPPHQSQTPWQLSARKKKKQINKVTHCPCITLTVCARNFFYIPGKTVKTLAVKGLKNYHPMDVCEYLSPGISIDLFKSEAS